MYKIKLIFNSLNNIYIKSFGYDRELNYQTKKK